MLETLLQIGKTLRAEGRMRHHRFIKPAPLVDKKTKVAYFSLPVREDFSFDFDGLRPIQDEDYIKHQLYYLTYKSGEADSLVKYLFGDICWGRDKKGKEMGFYRMHNPAVSNLFGVSSYYRCQEDAKYFAGTAIEKFRQSFEPNIERIESWLEEQGQGQYVLLHFDFARKHWYDFAEELQAINRHLLSALLEEQSGWYVLKNFLYKTLVSGAAQAPAFNNANLYKTKSFASTEEVLDLLYAIDYSKKPLISERDIKIIVLPKGNNLKAKHIEDFFERHKGFDNAEDSEDLLKAADEAEKTTDDFDDFLDSMFTPVLAQVAENITHYDFVFSKKGGSPSTPDVDMLEIAGLERSKLAELGKRAGEIRQKWQDERARYFTKLPKDFVFLDIRRAFLHILGDVTTDKKKYQSHLFKVLPQIYTGTYYRDPILLPAFIEQNERHIREGEPKFNLLKFDFYFLTHLSNADGEKQMNDIKDSPSYQAGLRLGLMAQPLNRKIASFEKNYVGLLSRRISDRAGLVKFANFINEKLAIHEVAFLRLKQAFAEFAEIVGGMAVEKDYQKHLCAFGFFEGYFALRAKGEDANEDTPQPDEQPTLFAQE